MYTSYELGEEYGERVEFTLDELAALWEFTVDKSKYPDFGGWLWDMERSAMLYRQD